MGEVPREKTSSLGARRVAAWGPALCGVLKCVAPDTGLVDVT